MKITKEKLNSLNFIHQFFKNEKLTHRSNRPSTLCCSRAGSWFWREGFRFGLSDFSTPRPSWWCTRDGLEDRAAGLRGHVTNSGEKTDTKFLLSYFGFLVRFVGDRQLKTSSRTSTTVCITDLDKLILVKLAYDGKVLSSAWCSLLPQLPQKTTLASKEVKINTKIIISVR